MSALQPSCNALGQHRHSVWTNNVYCIKLKDNNQIVEGYNDWFLNTKLIVGVNQCVHTEQ